MKGFERKNQLLSLCGLNCALFFLLNRTVMELWVSLFAGCGKVVLLQILLRLRQIYTRLRKKREWGAEMYIMSLKRKESRSYEEDNKYYITGIGKIIEKKRIPVRFNHGVGYVWGNGIRCACVSG